MTTTRLKTLLLAICVGGSASIAGAQTIDPIVEVGKQRTAAAKASQAKIDRLADETASLLTDYKTVMKQVDGLKVYNARLERQIANQEKRIRGYRRVYRRSVGDSAPDSAACDAHARWAGAVHQSGYAV